MSNRCDARFNELQTAISNLRIELIEKIEDVRAPENIEIKPEGVHVCVENLEKHVKLSELAKAVNTTIATEFDLPLVDNGNIVESIQTTEGIFLFNPKWHNTTFSPWSQPLHTSSRPIR